MPESRPPIDLQGISLAELQKAARRAPHCRRSISGIPSAAAHSGMRIARDGTWYHEGRPIQRRSDGAAVFDRAAARARRPPRAGHPRREARHRCRRHRLPRGGDAKRRRRAESATSHSASTAATLSFSTPSHPLADRRNGARALRRDSSSATGSRRSLRAPSIMSLAELALAEGCDPPGIWSSGTFFPLESANEQPCRTAARRARRTLRPSRRSKAIIPNFAPTPRRKLPSSSRSPIDRNRASS